MKKPTIIATANNKGGCGKTTTAIAVAAELAARGLQVLLVDIDSQCNATQSMPQSEYAADTYSLLQGRTAAPVEISQNLYGIRSSRDMAAVEMDMPELQTGRAIADMLKPYGSRFDVVMIDTPPATGLLTINALKAADYVLIPLQASLYGLQGVVQLTGLLQRIGQFGNVGIVLTMYDGRKNVHKQLREKVREYYDTALFDTTIRSSVAVTEAPLYGRLLRDYAPKATATEDYCSLTTELLQRIKKNN